MAKTSKPYIIFPGCIKGDKYYFKTRVRSIYSDHSPWSAWSGKVAGDYNPPPEVTSSDVTEAATSDSQVRIYYVNDNYSTPSDFKEFRWYAVRRGKLQSITTWDSNYTTTGYFVGGRKHSYQFNQKYEADKVWDIYVGAVDVVGNESVPTDPVIESVQPQQNDYGPIAVNLISNSSFEIMSGSQPTNWTPVGSPSVISDGFNGVNAIHVTDSNYYKYRYFYLDPNQDHTISFYAKSTGTTKAVAMLEYYDVNRAIMYSTSYNLPGTGNLTSDYVRYIQTVPSGTIPLPCKNISLTLKSSSSTAVTIDAVQVEQNQTQSTYYPKTNLVSAFLPPSMISAPNIRDNSITGLNIAAETISGDHIIGGTITGNEISSATKIVAGTGDNVGVLDGEDATYRIYAGSASPASAPFRVTQSGELSATKATISTASANQRMVMDSSDNTLRFYDASNTNVITIDDSIWGLGSPGMGVSYGGVIRIGDYTTDYTTIRAAQVSVLSTDYNYVPIYGNIGGANAYTSTYAVLGTADVTSLDGDGGSFSRVGVRGTSTINKSSNIDNSIAVEGQSTISAGSGTSYGAYFGGYGPKAVYGVYSDARGASTGVPIGVYGTATTDGGTFTTAYALQGRITMSHGADSSTFYGMFAEVSGLDNGKTSTTNIAVYGTAEGAGTNYAAYFEEGDVKILNDIYVEGNANFTGSDVNISGNESVDGGITSQSLTIVGVDDTNTNNLVLKHSSSPTATGIEWKWSVRANNEDLWLYGWNGSSAKNVIEIDWTDGSITAGESQFINTRSYLHFGYDATISVAASSNTTTDATTVDGSTNTLGYRMIRSGKVTGISLQCNVTDGGGAGELRATVQKNGTNQSMYSSCTVDTVGNSGGNTSDTNTFTFAAGDQINIELSLDEIDGIGTIAVDDVAILVEILT